MAVAYKMHFEGATLDQYDQVMELMGLTRDSDPPEGAIFHWVAATDTGLVVVDVWESDAQFEKFAEEKIGPFTAQVGISGPPTTTRFEVYNTLGARSGAVATS